jgi:hypothetical protein
MRYFAQSHMYVERAMEAIRVVYTKADKAAKVIFLNSLTEEKIVRVMNQPTARAMLTLVDQFHTSKSQVSLALVLTKHRTIHMQEEGDIQRHLSEYDQIMAEIHTLGGTISEDQLVWKALLSLPASWKSSVSQIAS